MAIRDWFRRSGASAKGRVQAMAGETFGLHDPRLLEFMRAGGVSVSTTDAMKVPAVYRSVMLISGAMGMLPMHLIDKENGEKAKDHSLYRLLHRKPNKYQSAFTFRQMMTRSALLNGDAYAQIVRSGPRVLELRPIPHERVSVKHRDDWSVEYEVSNGSGMSVQKAADIFHLKIDTEDGVKGVSLVKQAASAIELANQAEQAALNLFRKGMMAGGVIKFPGELTQQARDHIKASLDENYAGTENAHKWMVLEQGATAEKLLQTAADAQQVETRRLQIEEIARIFGTPRPLLALDDTSWGSGIDVLGQLFVRFALNPWFEAWQQEVSRTMLSDEDQDRYEPKFNAGALLRGNMKDSSDFFAKALGAGGHQPWMHYDEVRELSDLPRRELEPNPMTNKGPSNEPSNTPAR